MASFYISLNRWRPAWLVAVILMLLSPVVAHAYEYVELEGGEYTSSYLASVCSGKHVFFNGDATLIINENLSIKEIYSWGKVTIISNGHRFDIEQDDASRNAMTIWGGLKSAVPDLLSSRLTNMRWYLTAGNCWCGTALQGFSLMPKAPSTPTLRM